MKFLKLKNKQGFTLSETLIALAMIGVLGAVLIPVIIAKKPNPNKIMLRKEYNILEKVVSKLINDNTLYPSTIIENVGGVNYQSGFHYMTDPTLRSTTGGITYNKFCYYLVENLNTIGLTSCPASTSTSPAKNFAQTSDGALWFIYPTASQFNILAATPYKTKIIIDVNGSAAPNCLDDSNGVTYQPPSGGYYSSVTNCLYPDTFIIGVAYNGKLQIGSGSGNDHLAESYLAAPLDNKN